MDILVQTSSTDQEDDHFSMATTSPSHNLDALRSMYCKQQKLTLSPGPKGVRNRMSSFLTSLTAQLEGEDQSEHQSVPETAFLRNTTVKGTEPLNKLVAKINEVMVSDSTHHDEDGQGEESSEELLQENSDLQESDPMPTPVKGIRRHLPVRKGKSEPPSEPKKKNTLKKKKLKPGVKRRNSTESEMHVHARGYIPYDVTITSNKIPRHKPIVIKTSLEASIESFTLQKRLRPSNQ